MIKTETRSVIIRFIILFGIINLFADLTYEGARSINGAFLGTLGASAFAVGIIAGLGELVGYALRLAAGRIVDKTHQYWLITIAGYVINMLAVPALALAGSWQVAAALIVAERTGRAIRKPSVDTMLSFTTPKIGSGRVFGINEALDQGGATVGPLIVALMVALRGSFRAGYAVLLISALLCLACVFLTMLLYPRPGEMEEKPQGPQTSRFTRSYWLLLAAGGLIAAGFVDFALIAFHFQQTGMIAPATIPVYYAVAMGVGAVGAFAFGQLYDRLGTAVLIAVFLLSAFFAPLIFLGTAVLALVGMILWGIGMGAQESLLKAIVSGMLPQGKRSTAFGLFDAGFGVAWFAGSALMGFLYQYSLPALIIFSVVTQLASLPIFWYLNPRKNASTG